MNERIAAGSGYCEVGSDTRMVSRPSGRNPTGTCVSLVKLCSSRPAPTSSISVSATSAITSGPAAPRRDVARGPAPLSASTGACRPRKDDGTSPKTTPATSDTTSENASARPFTAISEPRGSPSSAERAKPTPQNASSTPARPPASASRTLSLTSHRVRSRRLAPSATRIAASCARPAARTRSRLATFAQATSSTSPTAPINTSSGDLVLPTVRSRTGTSRRLASGSASVLVGCARAYACAMASTSPCACSTRAPGRRRATAWR